MRAPACWLAALRIVVGAWFLKGAVAKITIVLAWGWMPLPGANARWLATMPALLGKYAAENPIGAYRAFLLDTVIPNASLFASLTALGETVVAISLVLGMLTPLGAAVGLFLAILYGLAVQHMISGQLGFHLLLVSLMLAFFFARAGRTWGLDARLRARWPTAVLTRRLT